jgi:hypothetical protein
MSETAVDLLVWTAIAFCASQSALFSGLNLAFFGVSRLRLETEAATGDRQAQRVLRLRRDPNLLLATILWGNVAINVLLTMMTNAQLPRVAAFFVSTMVITFLGEVVPQAYFSRHPKKMASLLAPILGVYRWLLTPFNWPTARMLDLWLGGESPRYFRERDLEELLKRHAAASEADDVSKLEGFGAANFLALDDIAMEDEGELVDPESVITLYFEGGRPMLPPVEASPYDPLIRRIASSGKKWVVLADADAQPQLVLDANGFLRQALLDPSPPDVLAFCHRPIVVEDPKGPLGAAIQRFEVKTDHPEDDVIDRDIILLWTEQARVITGTDILGRLLRGIVKPETGSSAAAAAAPDEAP